MPRTMLNASFQFEPIDLLDNSDNEREFSFDYTPIVLTEEQLVSLREKYNILSNIGLHLPEDGQLSCQPSVGMVTLHTGFFKSGLNFPLPFTPFWREVINRLDVALGKLDDNV